jgi:hypothetical protein
MKAPAQIDRLGITVVVEAKYTSSPIWHLPAILLFAMKEE